MFVSSVAVLALASSAAMPSLGTFLHMHPHAPDTRVCVVLVNKASLFRDVSIDGHVYTVRSHQTITVKAPAGTEIHTASAMPQHHKGDLLVALTPELNNKTVTLN